MQMKWKPSKPLDTRYVRSPYWLTKMTYSTAYLPKNGTNDYLLQEVEKAVMISGEGGYLERIVRKYTGNLDACKTDGLTNTPLPLKPMLGIVFLIIVGSGVGLVAFISEILISSLSVVTQCTRAFLEVKIFKEKQCQR